MKKFIPFLCLFLSILINRVVAQGMQLAPDIDFAASLFAQEQYKAAAKEYLRVYYYDRTNSQLEASRKIAQCFDHLGDGSKALHYMTIYLRQRGLSPNVKLDGYYEKLQMQISYLPIKHAISEFYQMPYDLVTLDPDRYNYYGSNLFLIDGDISKAREHLSQLTYAEHIDQNKLEQLFKDFEKNKNKSHLAPRLMSAALPGLGQSVNGEYRDAANSFLLNGSLIALFIKVGRSLSYPDAFLSVGPWLGKYFLGGMGNASKASRKKQRKRKQKHLVLFNELLQNASVQ